MDGLLNFLANLVFLPILGATALVLIGAVAQTALAPTTPGWQKYLWCLGAGYVLLHLQHFLSAVADGAGQ